MEVWRSRIFPFEEHPVEYICFAPTSLEPRVLVNRSRGSLELWDSTTWQVRYAVAGQDLRYYVRQVAWFPKEESEEEAARLGVAAFYIYTVGFSGHITQWDAANLVPLSHVNGGGGRIWTLTTFQESRTLAIGCNDGTLRLFQIPESGSEPEYTGRRIQVSADKIISSCRVETDEMYVGHVDGLITRWSLKTRTCEAKITLENRKDIKALCWALQLLPEHNILASGDSFGTVSMWDCVTHVLVQRFACHQADVLCLAANADQSCLIAGSADSRVSIYSVQGQSADLRWDFVRSGYEHDNDVRTVSVDPLAEGDHPLWLSGSQSGTVLVHHRNKVKECSVFSPFFHIGAVAPKTQLAACQGFGKLEIWYLPAPDKQEPGAETPLGSKDLDYVEAGYIPRDDDELPRAQFVMTLAAARTASGGQRHLLASHIREDGQLVAMSDMAGTRLFHINVTDLAVKQVYVPSKPLDFRKTPCRALRFCGPGNTMLAAATFIDHRILFVDPTKGVLNTMEEHKHPVHLLDANAEWLASADSSGAVHLTNLDTCSHFARVPTSSARGVFPTALGINHPRLELLVALSDHRVLVYKIEEDHVSPVANLSSLHVPRTLLRDNQRISGISVILEQPDMVLLWGESFLLSLNLEYAAKLGGADRRDGESSSQEMTRPLAPDRITTIGAWRLYPKLKHMLSFCSVPAKQWGDPILATHKVGPAKRPVESGQAVPEKLIKKARMELKHVVVSLEASPEAVKAGNPTPFERKQYQRQNLYKKQA
mmetsp:Transcript_34369/g.78318  ORF Transcript_34369/g.78318 Transcript_34369/m.78318 type:complete len:767 (-) Transcript_34369:44-2344(-)